MLKGELLIFDKVQQLHCKNIYEDYLICLVVFDV